VNQGNFVPFASLIQGRPLDSCASPRCLSGLIGGLVDGSDDVIGSTFVAGGFRLGFLEKLLEFVNLGLLVVLAHVAAISARTLAIAE
jgi:hypothetical protein